MEMSARLGSVLSKRGSPNRTGNQSGGHSEEGPVRPEGREATDEGLIRPTCGISWIKRAVAERRRELVLKCLQNDARIAVDIVTNREDRDLAVGEVEQLDQDGPGHHRRNLDEGIWNLLKAQGQADLVGERGRLCPSQMICRSLVCTERIMIGQIQSVVSHPTS